MSSSSSPQASPRGVAAGGLLSRAELEALLGGAAPAQLLTRVHEHAEHAGWLRKEGLKWRTWKRRWFVLKQQCLFYFDQPRAPRALGVALLAGGAQLSAMSVGRILVSHGVEVCSDGPCPAGAADVGFAKPREGRAWEAG